MINLSKRLKKIADYIPENSRIVDIGCDHALLDIYLVQTKKTNQIIASDINPNALKNAKKNIKKYNLEDKIKTIEIIRQIEAKALRKLRHPSRSRKLKDFLND